MADTPDNKERELFEQSCRNMNLERSEDGRYISGYTQIAWEEWPLRAARRAPAIGAVPELPALPKHAGVLELIVIDCQLSHLVWGYTASQMQQYAVDAIAADRQTREVEAFLAKMGEPCQLGEAEANHEEAYQLAAMKRNVSNLARAYLDLRTQLAAKSQGMPVAAQYQAPGEAWEDCGIHEEVAMRAHGYDFRLLYAAIAPTQSGAQPQGESNAKAD